jgi:uncharacterized protein with gpF-like domain
MANYRVIPATEPADALADEYHSLLDASLEGIQEKLVQPFLDELKLLAPAQVMRMAMDSPSQGSHPRHRDMIRSFIARFADWTRGYEAETQRLASWFGSSSESHASNVLKHNLARALGKPVHLRITPALERQLEAVVAENVTLIRSIHGVYAEQVTTMVMESVTQGRDIASLAQGLEERFGVARSRARLIAVDQNNKATAFIDRQRRMDLGIRKGRWRHMWSQHPRADHQAADGTEYDLEQGCLIGGKYIHPGEEINCNCLSESIIPNLAEWTPGTDLALRTA